MLSGGAGWVAAEPWLLWSVRVALVGLVALVSVSDVRYRRIPNSLVVAGLALALLWHGLAPAGAGLFERHHPGALGIGAALAGAGAAFAVFQVLHLARMMGAGDVKLMAMLGAFFGVGALPALVVLVFGAGGLLVAARLFDRERRRVLAANLRIMLFGRLAALTGGVGPRFDPARDTAERLPFGLAIAGGVLLLAALQCSGGLA